MGPEGVVKLSEGGRRDQQSCLLCLPSLHWSVFSLSFASCLAVEGKAAWQSWEGITVWVFHSQAFVVVLQRVTVLSFFVVDFLPILLSCFLVGHVSGCFIFYSFFCCCYSLRFVFFPHYFHMFLYDLFSYP